MRPKQLHKVCISPRPPVVSPYHVLARSESKTAPVQNRQAGGERGGPSEEEAEGPLFPHVFRGHRRGEMRRPRGRPVGIFNTEARSVERYVTFNVLERPVESCSARVLRRHP